MKRELSKGEGEPCPFENDGLNPFVS